MSIEDARDLLDAFLDDELDPGERNAVAEALAASHELRAELDELRRVRSILRSLPAVAPHRPLAEVMSGVDEAGRLDGPARRAAAGAPTSRRRGRRFTVALVAAAVWLVMMSAGVTLGRLPVVPDLELLSDQHASAEPMDGFVEMDAAKMRDDAIMDDVGHDMARDRVFAADELVQVRYSDGEHAVSVFHQVGDVDWSGLPAGGKMAMMEDHPMWVGKIGGRSVTVTERGDLVVTVVADDTMPSDTADDMTMHVSMLVPEVEMDESWWSRLWSAPGNVLDRL